jgi:hypothetical protein
VKAVEEFNQDETEYFIFMLSTKAGGQGLNLQSADTVIIFDSDWNPQNDEQAKARAHRIGTKHEVLVIRFITAHSVEMDILARCGEKLDKENIVIKGGDFSENYDKVTKDAQMRQLLDEKDTQSGKRTEAHSWEDVNQILARNDQELEEYRKIDQEILEKLGDLPPLQTDKELPTWLIESEAAESSSEQMASLQYGRDGFGRGQRERTHVAYCDETNDDFDMIPESERPRNAMTKEQRREKKAQRDLLKAMSAVCKEVRNSRDRYKPLMKHGVANMHKRVKRDFSTAAEFVSAIVKLLAVHPARDSILLSLFLPYLCSLFVI